MKKSLLVLFLLLTSGCGKTQNLPTTLAPVSISPIATIAPTLLPAITPTSTLRPPLSGSGGGVIAFVSTRDGNQEIYFMNADGSDQRRITSNSVNDGWVSWSPDGSQFVYHSVRSSKSTLNIKELDSGKIRQVPVSLPGYLWEPAWSHTGDRLAFSQQPINGKADLYLINIDGTGLQRLTKNLVIDAAPYWSPDDTRIVYSSEQDGNWEVYVMNADGSNPLNLTNNPARDYMVDWSPDGSRLVFVSNRDGNDEIYVMSVDGSGIQRLTENPSVDSDPHWSPDGTKIVFTSERDGNPEIYILTIPEQGAGESTTGAELKRLTDNSSSDFGPVWKPTP